MWKRKVAGVEGNETLRKNTLRTSSWNHWQLAPKSLQTSESFQATSTQEGKQTLCVLMTSLGKLCNMEAFDGFWMYSQKSCKLALMSQELKCLKGHWLLPLSLGLGSLERWGYVHQPRRLEVKDLACAGLKETLWFCILHVRHCVPQWSAKFAHENPKQTSRPVSGNAPLVYMQRCIAGESCCHLEVGTNGKLEVFWKVNLLWRVWQHGAESVVKKKCKESLRGIMR